MSDFYARYHTLQLLKGLVVAAPLQLQQVRMSQHCPDQQLRRKRPF